MGVLAWSKEFRDGSVKSFSSLPDDIVYKILMIASSYPWSMPHRTLLPLVCKKWREVLYFQGRPLKLLHLSFCEDDHSLAAIGQWLLIIQVRCNEEDKAGIDTMKVKPSLDTAGCQELSVCLGILGPALDELRLEYSGTQLFTSKSLRTLWTCPGLRNLNLDDFNFSLDAEDIRVGLQHLRQLEYLSIWHDDDDDDVEHTFPTELFGKLSNLQTMLLKKHKFTGTPSVLAQLSQLHCLRLDTCTWRCRVSGPVVIGSSLRNLALRDVGVQPGDDQEHVDSFAAVLLWESMPGLQMLELDEGAGAELPSGVLNCTNLQELELQDYQGLDLQPCFSDLGQLLVLRLTDCSFQQLPAWVSQLPSLKSLEVDGCSIPAEHAAVSSAPTLQSFECPVSTMDKACLLVCNLTNLTSLGLTFCNLAAVHPALAHLVHLLSLDISDNNLYPEVPQELAKLSTLTFLNLSRNATSSQRADIPLKLAPNGRILVPKMRVTQRNCGFMLHFPSLSCLGLSVTEEEKAALRGLFTKLEIVRSGAIRFLLGICEEFVPENIRLV